MQPSYLESQNSTNGLNERPPPWNALKKRIERSKKLKEETEKERKLWLKKRVEPKPIDLGEYKFGFHR